MDLHRRQSPLRKRHRGSPSHNHWHQHHHHQYRPSQPPQHALQASRNPEDALSNAAPIFITVGPQCCGKSTLLKELDPNMVDISLDDQPGVYIPIPTECFLRASSSSQPNNTNETTPQYRLRLEQHVVHGKSLWDRMTTDNPELMLILQRWKGRLSPQNFAVSILQLYQQQQKDQLRQRQTPAVNATQVAHTLIRATEDFLANHTAEASPSAAAPLPEATQLFVFESLFKPHPQSQQSAIDRAHQLLRQTPTHLPVAWGNTNSRPRDYQNVLEIACQTRRPVRFVICAPLPSGPTSSVDAAASIPWVPFQELLRRNLERYSRTGKFVPAIAIAECAQRVEELTNRPPRGPEGPISDLEHYLVEMAVPRRGKQPPAFSYKLTRHRLVRKAYPDSHVGTSKHGGPPGDRTAAPRGPPDRSYRRGPAEGSWGSGSRDGRPGTKRYPSSSSSSSSSNHTSEQSRPKRQRR